MVYKPHTLVAFGGDLGLDWSATVPGPEIWECTVRIVDSVAGAPLSDPAGYMANLHAALGTWFTTQSLCGVGTGLRWLKVNNIGADGKYVDKTNTNVFDYAPALNGTQAQPLPYILGFVTTWRTARTRPPGAFGRIYLPNATTDTNGGVTISDIAAGSYADAGVSLLHVLRDAGDSVPAIPVVASRVDASNTPITHVAVGNVVDVQRRRKDAIPEAYQTRAV